MAFYLSSKNIIFDIFIKDLFSLTKRNALITGASGKLGKVISKTLAQLGANLCLVDIKEDETISLADDLKKRYDVCTTPIVCDLECQDSRKQLIEKVFNIYGDLSILINNAAYTNSTSLPGWNCSFKDQMLDSWQKTIEVNLTAPFELCQGVLPLLEKNNSGSIINIASIYGIYGPDWKLYEETEMSNPASYAASKGGLVQLTRWLANTLAPKVRVNCLSPGGILRDQPKAFIEKYEARTPLSRMAKEEDIMGAIAFFASDASNYITGQNLVIDGGWGV